MAHKKDLLKFITCGSVDDGKSTLIGHMLYDAKLIFADQQNALEMESKSRTSDGSLDYSLLLDGLMAEREQGITIDVAYRFFSTEKRSFIVADTPGHEEYTRNMAVGASFANLAVILIDAQKGVLPQTRRHLRICALMGICDFVFAVNKMDLVDYKPEVFVEIQGQVETLIQEYKVHSLAFIPISASTGENLTHDKGHLFWHDGKTLLHYLESVDPYVPDEDQGFCMPVQRVCRPDATFRGFQGQICTGHISVGEEVQILPSGEKAHVSQVIRAGKTGREASHGDPVTLCLDREVDISRGCVLTKGKELKIGRRFAATLLWMDETPVSRGKCFLMKTVSGLTPVTVTKICYGVDINTGEHSQTRQVEKNGIALCEITADVPVVFDLFDNTRELGELILIDRITYMTSACGVIKEQVQMEGQAIAQDYSTTRALREQHNGHPAVTIWFTGLSGAGKSTLADELEKQLFASGIHTMVLDGDNVRMGLCKDLGYSKKDRKENIRRVAETAKLLNDAGVVVLACFVSPSAEDRAMAREIIGSSFLEVYVSTSLAVCEERDTKGFYRRARQGELSEFTGITAPYDVPTNPEITVDTATSSIADCVAYLREEVDKYLLG